MSQESWYGAKCIFLHTGIDSCPGKVYEERIVLIRASGFDKAIVRAEKEAQAYACECEDCSYTGFIDVYHIYDEEIGEGAEVYSLMRTSKLEVKQYLDHFYDTGDERSQK